MSINFCAREKISWYIHVASAQTVKFVKGFSLESFHKTAKPLPNILAPLCQMVRQNYKEKL